MCGTTYVTRVHFMFFCIRLKFFISFVAKMSLNFLLCIMKNSVHYFGGMMMEIAHISRNLMLLITINLVIKLQLLTLIPLYPTAKLILNYVNTQIIMRNQNICVWPHF